MKDRAELMEMLAIALKWHSERSETRAITLTVDRDEPTDTRIWCYDYELMAGHHLYFYNYRYGVPDLREARKRELEKQLTALRECDGRTDP